MPDLGAAPEVTSPHAKLWDSSASNRNGRIQSLRLRVAQNFQDLNPFFVLRAHTDLWARKEDWKRLITKEIRRRGSSGPNPWGVVAELSCAAGPAVGASVPLRI